MKYRPEIDGLRAVAVLPVILFHAGFSTFAGGYVGVDVFFVISGYLITTILIGEREAGTYSLLGFYGRRARRILPALFLVLICTIPFAWRWLAPGPFEDYARSQAFAALFVSNIHFLENSSYYDIGSAFRPLLHTWSLAVEEQFYLLFPLVLLPLGAFARPKFAMVFLVLAVLSLALAEWGWRAHPDENFYFTFSRLWEILVGSICAVILFARPRMKSDVLGLLGLLLILYSIFFYSAAVPFPSVYALVPVGGAALIILFADRGTWTARMLSCAPMVWIGLLSYSAYLWHQPLFAFARIRSVDEPSLGLMAALSVATMALAYVTWRFVETPFRRRGWLSGRGAMLGASVTGIATLVAFGLAGSHNGGFPDRVRESEPGFLTALRSDDGKGFFVGNCTDAVQPDGSHFCQIYRSQAPTATIAIMGDSHASAMAPALRNLSETRNVNVLRAARGACPPLLGVYRTVGGSLATECNGFAEAAAREAVERNLDAVFLTSRWSLYATGEYGNDRPQHALSPYNGVHTIGTDQRRMYFRQAVERTVAFYDDAGIDVFLVEEVPLQWVHADDLVARAILLGLDEAEARALFAKSYALPEQVDAVQGFAKEVLGDVARDTNAVMVSTARHFWSEGAYQWLEDDRILYSDDNHLSVNGAIRLQPVMTAAYDRRTQLSAGSSPNPRR